MGKMIDMAGWKMKEHGFPESRITVIQKSENKKNNDTHVYWLCKCDCGRYFIASGKNLRTGKTLSCGCFRKEASSKRNSTHHMSKDRLYHIWLSIKARCHNPKLRSYKDYGGRGITVCDEWKYNFENFEKWANENGYSDDLSIDRIDVNGNYEPSNCRWADILTQANNKRNNVYISYKGDTLTLNQWAVKIGINRLTLRYRLYNLKWSVERALTEPIHNTRRKKDVV